MTQYLFNNDIIKRWMNREHYCYSISRLCYGLSNRHLCEERSNDENGRQAKNRRSFPQAISW